MGNWMTAEYEGGSNFTIVSDVNRVDPFYLVQKFPAQLWHLA